jgi:hypothetical protein
MKVKLFILILTLVLMVIVWNLAVGSTSKSLSKDLQEQLVHSASFEVLALNPVPISDSDKFGTKFSTNTDTLLHYPILGHAKIDDQNLRRELVSMISKDIAKPNHLPRDCILEPRHGIRCIDGSNSVQIAICYHCGDVLLERNGKDEDYLIKMDGVLLSPASKKLFEKVFREAGIKTDVK